MIQITIPGRPVPKGRPRLGYRGRKAFIYTPPETREYEKLVAWAAKSFCKQPLNTPVEVDITLYFDPKAKKLTKSGRKRKITIPDLDNVAKSICDGLNKVAFDDDRQVVRLTVERRYDRKERAEVVIREAQGECG